MKTDDRGSSIAAPSLPQPDACNGPHEARVVKEWHQKTPAEVCLSLGTDVENGLSGAEAQRRGEEYGRNELPEPEDRGTVRILRDQFCATMVVLLIVAGLISLALQDYKDAIAIFAIVLLNAAVGFVQEFRAEKAMQALRRLAAPVVKIRRGGSLVQSPARDLVPGDIVLLEPGAIIPADGRIVEAISLQMDESALTGESIPMEKGTDKLVADAPLAERANMVYQGTVVTEGRGTAVVTAIGVRTELGRIAEMLGKVENEQTPLQRRLDELSRSLALVALALVAVIFVVGLLRGESLTIMFLTAVSTAVAAVPEGLPAVVTIALALGAQRMLRRRALIRRLPAAETLGAVTVICSDKTGTLTENRMTVTSMEAGGEMHGRLQAGSTLPPAIELLLVAGALCNDCQTTDTSDACGAVLGDPTEVALVIAAESAGIIKARLDAAFVRVAEVPFSSERRRMTTVHQIPGAITKELQAAWLDMPVDGCVAFMKGSLESVLAACDRRNATGEVLTGAGRIQIREAGERLAQTGQRVLGFAWRRIDALESVAAEERDFVFLGLMGLSDPTRVEVKAAVQKCRTAGIRPLMITGDHHLTAQHVARELGIGGRVMTGTELTGLSPAQLRELVDEVSIYARVLPEHKFRIVEALQARGHVVSMTGDGVNDAPALKQADIGVAMGMTGSDVSKQASDMVLLDDNFSTIVEAVEEGRAIYDNIRKFIRYVLAGNLGEILVMITAPLCGLPLPLLALQILWINLASDGLNGLALSVEPPERDAMRRPPRSPAESVFAHGMARHILVVGLTLGVLALGIGFFYWIRQESIWQTAVFLTVAFGQIFQTFAARFWDESIFRRGFRSNRTANMTVLISSASTLAIVYLPLLQKLFGTVPLSLPQLVSVIGASTAIFWVVELEKRISRRRANSSSTS